MTAPVPALRAFALILLCLALYLPGQVSLPPFDRDEARFAQASHQMIESGNYVDIRFQEEVRYKKPVGIYWLQAASARLTGAADQIWAYRVPSWLGATSAVLLTAVLIGGLFTPQTGLLAALLLASCLLLGVEARMAKTDAVQLACIVLAQWALARVWYCSFDPRPLFRHPGEGRDPLAASSWTPAFAGVTGYMAEVFWLALGLGVLIKGPIILMVCGLTALVLVAIRREVAWLKPLFSWAGLALFALIVLPWLIAITFKSGGQFWVESVGKDLLAKAAGGQESHGAPPGFYLGTVFLTFWPWAPLLLPAGVLAWQRRRDMSVQFLSAWLLPVWLVFEVMPTKLLHYTLPVFPALAGLVALLLLEGGATISRKLWAVTLALAGLLLGLVAFGVPLAPTAAFMALSPDHLFDWAMLTTAPFSALGLSGGLILVAASVVMLQLRERRPLYAAALMLAGLVNFYAAAFAEVLPATTPLWVSRSAAELVAPYRADCPGAVTSLGYAEPSLVFLLGTNTVLADSWDEVTRHPESCQLLLIERHFQDTLPETLRPLAKELGTAAGFNYSKGDPVVLGLLRINSER